MNRERFEKHDLVNKFFQRIVREGIPDGLIGDDCFSVDGTLDLHPYSVALQLSLIQTAFHAD